MATTAHALYMNGIYLWIHNLDRMQWMS